jgi:hypothetical protein
VPLRSEEVSLHRRGVLGASGSRLKGMGLSKCGHDLLKGHVSLGIGGIERTGGVRRKGQRLSPCFILSQDCSLDVNYTHPVGSMDVCVRSLDVLKPLFLPTDGHKMLQNAIVLA